MNETVLVKHPGAIIEMEMEKEDGKPLFDIYMQGSDGKYWEIEYDDETGPVLER